MYDSFGHNFSYEMGVHGVIIGVIFWVTDIKEFDNWSNVCV